MTNLVTPVLAAEEAPFAQGNGDDGALFELHPAPSLLLSRDGSILRANAAARELLRLPVGGSAALEDHLPGFAMQLAAALAEICQPRCKVRRADGGVFAARVRAAPMAGPRAAWLVNIEDLADHDRALAVADREFEALTSAAGHDLRGPLRILKGFAEALEDECGAVLNDEGRTFLAEILKASERMEGLIDGLLTFSRAARAELAPESLDLTTLIELVLYEMRHAHAERIVECEVEPALNAWGDVRLMMTVLRGLIGNAWKFTAGNSGAHIRCHRVQHDGRDWICVSDNGVGFDMAQASRLFQPFTRLHRHDEFPGHGMGLATVKRIVTRHGGEIVADARPGEGTAVRFWLPSRPE